MKISTIFMTLIGLFFIACGGGTSSNSVNEVPSSETETLSDADILTVSENASIGTSVGKVEIPLTEDDEVETIELLDAGSGQFTISEDGEIKTQATLQKVSNASGVSSEKMVKHEKIYTFRVKVTYASGKVVYIKVHIKVYFYTEVPDAEETSSNTVIELEPTIKGTPKTTINVYDAYQYLPTVSGLNKETLTFSIENKPSWALFDSTTGLLSGRVGLNDEINYNNIVISVSDGEKTVSLEPFNIEVKPAIDIAHKFGKATQGTDKSYRYYSPAFKSIDNNDSTMNHTSGGKNGKNWLQIELPSLTKVSKIVIQNRNGFASRLTNAKVYLSDRPFTGTVDENDFIKTLEATISEQVIVLPSSKSGTYLLIKGEQRAEDDRHIHLRKVEVYGATPVTPAFTEESMTRLISGSSELGAKVATVNAVDYQDDTISYRIVGDVPFSINERGEIVVDGVLDSSNYTFEVEANDGINTTRERIILNVTDENVIENLLDSGDVINTKVTEEELIEATIDEIEALQTFLLDAKVKIFNLNADGTAKSNHTSLTSLSWMPTKSSSMFLPTLGVNSAFLYSNAVESSEYKIQKQPFGILGEKGNGRYMLFGSNPFRTEVNAKMNQVLENSLAWLSGRDDLKTAPFNVVIAHLDEKKWFKDESITRAWLDTHFRGEVHYNSADSCDNDKLESCLNEDTNLLIISQVSATNDNLTNIASVVNQALDDGISVLYIHHGGVLEPLGRELFASVFDVTYYWHNHNSRLKLEDYNPVGDLNILPSNMQKIETMFTHFKNKDYNFDWNKCKDKYDNYDKNKDDCSEVVGLSSDFQEGATEIQKIMYDLDKEKKDIFSKDGYRVQKLLALTADKFRQSVVYPMDKVTTNDNEFMKSYYADHATYTFRTINPVQPDMGNFSRSDFSNITPITKTVNLLSKKKFRATGVYALPGQTMTITRDDSSDLTVKVFINTLRASATHQYQKNGYNRPKYLQSQHFVIKSGETIKLTSPYGGPVQLEFSKNDLPVEVTFENVGEHPYWASSADNDSFGEKMEANEYDWAEIATAGFTVHSKRDKMIKSISDERWGGTAEGLAHAVVQYTSNYPHVLAGFKGEGVDVVPEIHDWAEAKGLTIETIDIMKHMNADQAACGYGCSGNPYDAYWAFNPIGHGDIHEMGHSMQKKRFEGFPSHAATNTFAYYTKSRYFANTGDISNCGGQPFKKVFELIQSSVGEDNVTGYLKENLWDKAGLGEQYLLKIEAMMHAQKMGKVKNGWHVLARVHILEREMKRAKKDWEQRKASVGFDMYTLDEINHIHNNDWLIVAYSYAAEVDYRDYFDMMGIPYSQKAREQIASFHFDPVPKALFVSTDVGYCVEDEYGYMFDKPTLEIDGSTSYPY